jgi:hypothetical protein
MPICGVLDDAARYSPHGQGADVADRESWPGSGTP